MQINIYVINNILIYVEPRCKKKDTSKSEAGHCLVQFLEIYKGERDLPL
jgi:hypothetical protein